MELQVLSGTDPQVNFNELTSSHWCSGCLYESMPRQPVRLLHEHWDSLAVLHDKLVCAEYLHADKQEAGIKGASLNPPRKSPGLDVHPMLCEQASEVPESEAPALKSLGQHAPRYRLPLLRRQNHLSLPVHQLAKLRYPSVQTVAPFSVPLAESSSLPTRCDKNVAASVKNTLLLRGRFMVEAPLYFNAEL